MSQYKHNRTHPEYKGEKSLLTKEREYFTDISGPDPAGHSKAHVMLRYFIQYADGTTEDIDVITTEKPYVTVFKHAMYTYVALDFYQSSDMDLRMFWRLLQDYQSPANSVSYTDEELEQGYYYENGEKKMVYFPLIHLVLSPIGRETSYQLLGVNPMLPTLTVRNPWMPDPCVLQFVFDEEQFHVMDDLDAIDTGELQHEIMEEIDEEQKLNGRRR